MTNQTPPLPEVPYWGKASASEPTWPFYDQLPRQYRVNQQTGLFMRGSQDLGSELKLTVFDCRWDTGAMGKGVERWGFGLQIWLDVAFVDEQGFVSICSMKKDSATNLHIQLQEIYRSGAAPYCYGIHLRLDEMQGQDGTYFVARVADTRTTKEIEYKAIHAFVASNQFTWLLLGETTKGPHDDLPDGSDY
ncbi:MAG: hypothetical protein AAGI44_05865 [Pseudomonadota bacterium]